ncbi:hypothetical protein D9615_001861 [Tricholomella constricta]|uniref:Uncharacterized protein n=1 Tax=Tricholomella constricta TaxID=117010 RepID=A0A8H5HPY2_9AGAR|nr:hypothetical protein D9615_001861 [Tricholomella constricta]
MVSPNLIASPTLSAISSASSFVVLSDSDQSRRAIFSDDSEDEIVYSVSEESFLSSSGSSTGDPASDDDFVVLSPPRSPHNALVTGLSTPNGDDGHRANTLSLGSLTADLATLAVKDSASASSNKHRKRKGKLSKSPVVAGAGAGATRKSKNSYTRPSAEEAAASYPSPGPSPARPKRTSSAAPTPPPQKAVVKVVLKKNKKKATGLGARSVVDDASERFSEYGESENGSPSIYDEAVGYITSFLSNPAARKDSACRLTLLQALIIELGLASSSLPASLTSAKAFLKSRAFLNIREYLAVREQGPAAVQRIMHPSRNSLIKDIRKNRNKAPLGWVKDSGLQVLLVQCYH